LYESNGWTEKKLITVIQEETKRTEEKEEAGFTNVVDTTSTAKDQQRLKGKAVMSAPLFFHSAG